MLRELPETELSDTSDYERWYFEVQQVGWKEEEREAHQKRASGELTSHYSAQQSTKRETTSSSSSA